MDAIARVAFGLDTKNQNFVVSASAAFIGFMTDTWDKTVGFLPEEAIRLLKKLLMMSSR